MVDAYLAGPEGPGSVGPSPLAPDPRTSSSRCCCTCSEAAVTERGKAGARTAEELLDHGELDSRADDLVRHPRPPRWYAPMAGPATVHERPEIGREWTARGQVVTSCLTRRI